MSDGYYIAAKVEDENGYVMVRDCWGSYAPDKRRAVELTDGKASLFVSRETLATLVDQLRECQNILSEQPA